MTKQKAIQTYDYLIGAAGIFILFATLLYDFKMVNGYLMLYLIIAEIIIDSFRIYIRRLTISLSVIVDLSSFLIMGLGPALWIRFISLIVVDYIIYKKPLNIVFLNTGMLLLNILAGAGAYEWVENFLLDFNGGYFSYNAILLAFVFLISGLIVNYILLSVHILFDNPTFGIKILSESMMWDLVGDIISIPLSLEFANIYLFSYNNNLLYATLFMMLVVCICFIFYLTRRIVYANRQLKALSRVALSINEYLDLDKIYKLIFDTISSIVGFKGCYIFDFDEQNGQMVPVSYRVEGNEDLAPCPIDANNDVFKKMILEYKPFIINNIPRHPIFSKNDSIYCRAYKSCIIVPMRRSNRCTGCIGIFSDESNSYNKTMLEFLTVLSDQSAIAIDNTKLLRMSKQEAITDNLTHLYNQRYFYQYLNLKVDEYTREPGKMSLIMFDIDHFKLINDAYGHITGDYVLKEVATLIKSCVRKNDVVSRYGGEEFTVVLPDTDSEKAYAIAERIRENVEKNIFVIDGKKIRTTVSGGISEFPKIASSATDLLSYADRAMYIGAKFRGRNKIKIYDDKLA
ncbi:MAG TPA: hypothetical protein DD429_10700 [Clostridiaceae bacterium]|nr:hypothetical protein [Clostridiaceae bacterium]